MGTGPQDRGSLSRPSAAVTSNSVGIADGVALLNRLRLEGGRTELDVVLGLDTNLTAEAKATGLFAPHGISIPGRVGSRRLVGRRFRSLDYGHFAVVYDTEAIGTPPASMEGAGRWRSGAKIVIQDPRTSTPGLGTDAVDEVCLWR
jgi:thiamine transport system substrate-binding protein